MSADAQNKNRLFALCRRHLAALGYVWRIVLPVIMRTGRRPVIFSRYIGMGDIICTIPAAHFLRQRHPGAFFIYNCHPDFAAIPQIAGIASRVTTLEAMGIVGHWYGFLLGGFYHFAHGGDLPGQVAREPMTAEYCRQFDLPVTDVHPELAASPAIQEQVLRLLAQKKVDPARLVVIHPGPSWTVKEWPCEQWAQLVAGLREQGFTNIVQLGVSRYLTTGRVPVVTVPGTVSLVDELSIEACVAVIARAKLFIGIDSGLLHIAASTRTPTVGLWGSTSPRFFYAGEERAGFQIAPVECQGCEHQQPRWHWFTNCPHEIKCMKSLPVADTLQACLRVLARPPVGSSSSGC